MVYDLRELRKVPVNYPMLLRSAEFSRACTFWILDTQGSALRASKSGCHHALVLPSRKPLEHAHGRKEAVTTRFFKGSPEGTQKGPSALGKEALGRSLNPKPSTLGSRSIRF